MTYCLGIITRSGLVLAADSRTNAGVDYISTYRKLFDFSLPEERVIILCTSGNLSVTQAVISSLKKDIKVQQDVNLHSLPTFHEIARYVGSKVRQLLEQDRAWLEKDGIDYHCNFLVGGQIQGEDPELYLIYTQGNSIQATPETPFLQIGETKYGKPILDRTLHFDTPVDVAAKAAILSIDSTMKSNISVGPPINLVMYETDSLVIRHQLELPLRDPYLGKLRKTWEVALNHAVESIPNIDWEYYAQGDETDLSTD
ncbi:proteasome-type protease [Roseofilum capinflatum]|uniref:Proteasome-type protease n=1 Tax=Roseofilum capinflatum BLCC-M114 TaxID=3022440 RepID=A0ABT7BET8_9CYAN|nr:proteasome-type protease [Roseofilum capinflatum]MDJ1177036.1 proteasome-type protease [Roseofilum capinflatum BLCC-M114]